MAALIPIAANVGAYALKHWTWFAMAGLVIALSIDHARLTHAKADLTHVRGELATSKATVLSLRGSLAAVEGFRASEYAEAKTALGEAEKDCSARVAEARRSQRVIRQIVEKPVSLDPQTHCPIASLVGAGELRDALQPAH